MPGNPPPPPDRSANEEAGESLALPNVLKNVIGSKDQSEVDREALIQAISDQTVAITESFSVNIDSLRNSIVRQERTLEGAVEQNGTRLIDALTGGFSSLFNKKKSKEEITEERATTASLFKSLGQTISNSLGFLKPKEKKEGDETGWFGLLLKGAFLIVGAYVWRVVKPIMMLFNALKSFAPIARFFSSFKIPAFISNIFAPLANIITRVKAVGGFFGNILKFFKPLSGMLGGFFGIFSKFFGFFMGFKTLLKGIPIVGWIITAIEGIWGGIKGWMNSAGKSLLERIGETIQGVFAQIISGLTFGFLSYEDIMGFFGSITDALGDAFFGIYQFFAEDLPTFFTETIPNFFFSAGAAIGSFFTETIPNLFMSYIGFVAETGKAIWGFFTQTIPNALLDAVGFVLEMNDAIWGFFTQTIPNALLDAVGFVLEMNDAIWGFFTQTIPDFFVKTIPPLLIKAKDSFIDFFTKRIPDFFTKDIPQIIKGLLDSTSGLIRKALSWLGFGSAEPPPLTEEQKKQISLNRDTSEDILAIASKTEDEEKAQALFDLADKLASTTITDQERAALLTEARRIAGEDRVQIESPPPVGQPVMQQERQLSEEEFRLRAESNMTRPQAQINQQNVTSVTNNSLADMPMGDAIDRQNAAYSMA